MGGSFRSDFLNGTHPSNLKTQDGTLARNRRRVGCGRFRACGRMPIHSRGEEGNPHLVRLRLLSQPGPLSMHYELQEIFLPSTLWILGARWISPRVSSPIGGLVQDLSILQVVFVVEARQLRPLPGMRRGTQ